MIQNKGKKRNFRWIGQLLLFCLLMFGMVVSVWGESLTTDLISENDESVELEDTIPDKDENQYTIQFVDTLAEWTSEVTGTLGEAVTLPMPETVEGYRNIGWATTEDAEEAEYEGNASYIIEEDLVLYPVRVREYQLTFLTNAGSSTDRLKALTITGLAGETVTLPNLPTYSGYTSFGWTDTLKGTEVTHKEGSSYTIEGDAVFYQVNGHTVSFYNSTGSTKLSALTATTVGNAYMTLPSLPEKTGYQALGWAKTKNATTAKFAEGARVWIKADVTLYAVYKKVPVYTVKFYTYAGGYEYQQYRMKVNSGTTIKLPALPRVVNYSNVGWGTVKCAKESQVKKAGTKVKVTSNLNFYIYRKSAKTIQFMYNNGSGEYMSLRMDVTGTTAVLPSMKSPSGYSFLGWSTSKNKSSYPEYQMGQKITVTKGMKLYSVLMKTPMAEISDENLLVSSNYDTVYFIGDSRTVHLKSAVKNALGENGDKLQFYCQSGQGINWLEEHQADILNDIKSLSGKTAVVFNLGVNSLTLGVDENAMAQRYAAVMNSMAKSLKKNNCTMYFMSVNPANPKDCTNSSYQRLPEDIKYFNYLMKNALDDYTYIDTYNYLIKTGFELKDGLHYTTATYRKIYNKVITTIG